MGFWQTFRKRSIVFLALTGGVLASAVGGLAFLAGAGILAFVIVPAHLEAYALDDLQARVEKNGSVLAADLSSAEWDLVCIATPYCGESRDPVMWEGCSWTFQIETRWGLIFAKNNRVIDKTVYADPDVYVEQDRCFRFDQRPALFRIGDKHLTMLPTR